MYFYSFMFPGFPGGYNFILIMDIPCAGAGDAPALFLSGKLKEEDGGIDYSFGEFQGSDIAVMIPKAIDFCFGGKDMGYMLLESEEKRSLFYMAVHGERRYFENTSGLGAEALCNAYAGCHLWRWSGMDVKLG